MFHNRFKNIQSIIRVTKTLTDPKTAKETTYQEYLIANSKTSAEDFYNKILSHWRVETYHYHLDILLDKDDHFTAQLFGEECI